MFRPSNKRTFVTCSLMVIVIILSTDMCAHADYVLGPAVNSGPLINTSVSEIDPIPEPLTFWFARRLGARSWDNWILTRPTEDSLWGNPVMHGAWFESDWNLITVSPSFTTSDGLELYSAATRTRRPEGYGDADIYVKKRANIEDDWGPALNLGPTVNGPYDETLPAVSPDGLELYFSGWYNDARPGGLGRADLWVTRRASRDEDWGEPVNLGSPINSSQFDARPKLLANGLLLFFESNRPGGFGDIDLYVLKRATVLDPWSEPINLGPNVNSSDSDESGFLSPDGSMLYFHSDRPGGYGDYDIWQAPLITILDFNGDGRVDDTEEAILTASWGTDDSLCDIGPTAFGDGIVDEQDLAVLTEYLDKDFIDRTLVAHWPLDETEDLIASDTVGNTPGTIVGVSVPLWKPQAGRVGGALEFDGATCISTDPILILSDGPFSIVTWIKGGKPGQVIVSQIDGIDWLLADPEQGRLMVGPNESRRRGAPELISDVVITDGQWHRIVFVWDKTNRRLYVDDILVAEDITSIFSSNDGGIHIGCGKSMDTSTFWSGLIDDVRIYNRVVWP